LVLHLNPVAVRLAGVDVLKVAMTAKANV